MKPSDVWIIIYADPSITAADYGRRKLAQALMLCVDSTCDLEIKVAKHKADAEKGMAALSKELKVLTKRVERIEKKLDIEPTKKELAAMEAE